MWVFWYFDTVFCRNQKSESKHGNVSRFFQAVVVCSVFPTASAAASEGLPAWVDDLLKNSVQIYGTKEV